MEDLIMRKFVAVLSLAMCVSLYAADSKELKAAKSKEKRFEAVEVTARDVAGSYRGPAESYGLVIELADGGALRGNYVEMGRVAVLNEIDLHGAEFTARASFDDGSSRTITGSFAKRTLNGTSAFGLHMRNVPVEEMGLIDTFFERF
jgi:hypothetical protein